MYDSKFDEHVFLTKVEAVSRAAFIADVSYRVHLTLPRCETFAGHASISFSEKAPIPEEGFFLDFHGVMITGLSVDEQSVSLDESVFNGHRIYVKKSWLKETKTHSVELSFLNKYRNDGTSLHRFVDPEDSEDYLYTQFEAFFAHGVFPCFDQPDLRATLALSVTSEDHWAVICNTLENEDPAAVEAAQKIE